VLAQPHDCAVIRKPPTKRAMKFSMSVYAAEGLQESLLLVQLVLTRDWSMAASLSRELAVLLVQHPLEVPVPIDPHSSRALYRQLADQLRSKIYSGELKAGGQLPTERELMEQFDASRNTVRLALGQLANEGLTVSGRGRGHFVRSSAPLLFLATRSESTDRRATTANDAWTTDVIAQGRTPAQTIEVSIVRPPENVSSLLELEEGETAALRKRVRTVDGEPNSLSMSYYPMEIVGATEIIQPHDIIRGANRVLAEAGHDQVRYVDQITARMPMPEEKDVLRIGAGIPVHEHVRVGYDAGGVAVRVAVTVLPADRHIIQYELTSA
jgi:GntR family transcriptional regulator